MRQLQCDWRRFSIHRGLGNQIEFDGRLRAPMLEWQRLIIGKVTSISEEHDRQRRKQSKRHVLDGMVQFVGEAQLDTCTSCDRNDMADPISDHTTDIWFRVRASDSGQGELAGCVTLCDQFGFELDLHADSVWHA